MTKIMCKEFLFQCQCSMVYNHEPVFDLLKSNCFAWNFYRFGLMVIWFLHTQDFNYVVKILLKYNFNMMSIWFDIHWNIFLLPVFRTLVCTEFIYFCCYSQFLIYEINLKICGFLLKLSHKPLLPVFCGFWLCLENIVCFCVLPISVNLYLPLLQLEASMHQGSEQQMPSFNLPSKILCKVVNVHLRVSVPLSAVFSLIWILLLLVCHAFWNLEASSMIVID